MRSRWWRRVIGGGGVPRETWDRVSGRYDRQLWLERAALRAALDLLAATHDERVLDLATGTGAVLQELAGRAARPGEVVGIDDSAAMLARVPALPAGWSVRQGDARCLPFAAGSFEAAVAAYVLQVVPCAALATVLAELRRVLIAGGRLVTVTPVIPASGALRLPAVAFDALARRAPGRHGGMHALDPRDALRDAGFTLLAAHSLQRGYPSLCVLARA